ncbi:MAG: acyl-CoA dehydrogenase family protein, partial [Acidimicrobiia bacterium]
MGGVTAEAIRHAAEVARHGADKAEAERRLPAETAVALADAGLFTMCLPAVYGGPGTGPV